jgi:hypothetical protein
LELLKKSLAFGRPPKISTNPSGSCSAVPAFPCVIQGSVVVNGFTSNAKKSNAKKSNVKKSAARQSRGEKAAAAAR